MKRLALLLALSPVTAFADASSTITLTNNYIWRGRTFTNNLPAIQGSVDYAHESGLSAGVWMSNTEVVDGAGATLTDMETDLYGSYSYDLGDLSLSATFYWYTYIQEPLNNAVEYQLAAAYGPAKLEFGYMPEYFEIDTSSTYVKLGVKQPFTDTLSVVAHVGYSVFGDQDKAGIKNYIDYKGGISYTKEGFTTEVAYINTNRKDIDTATSTEVDTKDRAMILTISKTF